MKLCDRIDSIHYEAEQGAHAPMGGDNFFGSL
jgi:hypothetical protein